MKTVKNTKIVWDVGISFPRMTNYIVAQNKIGQFKFMKFERMLSVYATRRIMNILTEEV